MKNRKATIIHFLIVICLFGCNPKPDQEDLITSSPQMLARLPSATNTTVPEQISPPEQIQITHTITPAATTNPTKTPSTGNLNQEIPTCSGEGHIISNPE